MSTDENGEFEELTEENDPFYQLTDDFYKNVENYKAGLVALVNRNLDDFPSLGRIKDTRRQGAVPCAATASSPRATL